MHIQFPYLQSGKGLSFVSNDYNTTTSSKTLCMNRTTATSSDNLGGWKGSYAYTVLMPNFYSSLSKEVYDVIKSAIKWRDNVCGSDNPSYVTECSSAVWLLSEFEVQGSRVAANSTEQTFQRQYSYFANGGSKIKYKHNDQSKAAGWWLSSIAEISPSCFCYVQETSEHGWTASFIALGMSPAFVIA